MDKKPPRRKLSLDRETLRRLGDHELGQVAAAAATKGAPCDRSAASDCATCACPPPP